MDELIKSKDSGIISLLRDKDGNIAIPKPFEREIFLFDCHVAGTSHIEGIDEIVLLLNEGDRLDFFREPDNPHDKRAIAITNYDGIKIGYVPKADNIVFSRLMDAGKLLFGRINSKKKYQSWQKIDIKIYLLE
jgi:hypothetical protein